MDFVSSWFGHSYSNAAFDIFTKDTVTFPIEAILCGYH